MERITNWTEEIFFNTLSPQEKQVFDVVFVGGGPSTLSYLSYLFKNNEQGYIMKKNILIIEKGDSFGSGCLGKYGINSNTSAEGFVRLICQPNPDSSTKVKDMALSPDKLANQKATKKDLTVLSCFKELSKSSVVSELLKIGSKTCPLSLVGEFLQALGNFITSMIHKTYGKNILINNTEVTRILEVKSPSLEYEISLLRNDVKRVIRSKIVVMACGALPKPNSELKSIVSSYLNPERFLSSDIFLQENHFKKAYSYLCSTSAKLSPSRTKKVVIVGGSHSGFSSAWMLLNGTSALKSNSREYAIGKLQNCKICPRNQCSCFGKVNSLKWEEFNFEEINNLEIVIAYRDIIKVYYSTEREAQRDGYNIYDPKKAVNKNSNVYPFIGIRGDAKELYRSIVQNRERRVKLKKTVKKEDLEELIKDSCLVIWAGGYTTNAIPLFSNQYKSTIDLFFEEGGTCDVTKDMNILDINKKPIPNFLGIGQGFSTHSIEIIGDGKQGKADSINLYNTSTAKKLNSSLITLLSSTKIQKEQSNNNLKSPEPNRSSKAQIQVEEDKNRSKSHLKVSFIIKLEFPDKF